MRQFQYFFLTEYSDPFILKVNTIVADNLGPVNIKTVLSTYGDFHVKDKTAVRTSYL